MARTKTSVMKGLARKSPASKKTARPDASKSGAGAVTKKKHRWRPGTVALRQIRAAQRGTDQLIRRLPLRRLIRRLAHEHNANLRFQESALHALQEALEAHLIGIYSHSQEASILAKRITIMGKDMDLVVRWKKTLC